MSGLFEILKKIEARPGMYIGCASISNLFMFLAGYKTARRELGIEPNEKEFEFYREFQPWIQKRFNVQTVNSWAKIILLYSVDEKEGFNYFFKLLDEFLKRDNNEIVEKEGAYGVEVSSGVKS
ncbi:hypothetical protein [Argonema antarcticum]|uniref:hypothetical protein n=1 Tax=Argonema antarcticum TaxID=2942763 RepID=UPI002013AE54|nr:hypothetical protein [Argonema antarcticum]MCL1473794.1 hypothetical protein [Argonema antarcticum A004/B2]